MSSSSIGRLSAAQLERQEALPVETEKPARFDAASFYEKYWKIKTIPAEEKFPFIFRIGGGGGGAWSNKLNYWADDTKPAGLGGTGTAYIDFDIGRWVDLGILYRFNGYAGNGRPSNTSPMPSASAWYLTDTEDSHMIGFHPKVKLFDFRSEAMTTSIETVDVPYEDSYPVSGYLRRAMRKRTIFRKHGPMFTGNVTLGLIAGADLIRSSASVPHGYGMRDATLYMVGASIGTVWDMWLTEHVGMHFGLNAKYMYSGGEDSRGDTVHKHSTTMFSIEAGLSAR